MIKTADEIALMAESGRLLAQVFTRLIRKPCIHRRKPLQPQRRVHTPCLASGLTLSCCIVSHLASA